MKFKINKDEYNSLDEVFKKEYIEDAEGVYIQDIEDMPKVEPVEDLGKLKRAFARKKEDLVEANEKIRSFEEIQKNITTDDARKKGDIEKLEKSWLADKESIQSSLQGKIDFQQSFIKKQLVDNVAIQIASEITKSTEMILPHIKSRLSADFDGDNPSTIVLDKEGNKSIMSVSELKKEFVENPAFAPIIEQSKGSGSGAAGVKGKTGDATKNKLSDYSSLEQVALSRDNPSRYKELADKEPIIF